MAESEVRAVAALRRHRKIICLEVPRKRGRRGKKRQSIADFDSEFIPY